MYYASYVGELKPAKNSGFLLLFFFCDDDRGRAKRFALLWFKCWADFYNPHYNNNNTYS